MTNVERQFESELDIFRIESETAAQFFYGYLAVHDVAKHHKRVFQMLDQNALFWNTVSGGLQTSALIALGRVFDQGSPHNLDSVLRIAQNSPAVFSKAALAKRRQGNHQQRPEWLNEFLQGAYEPTATDFRRLRTHVKKYRRIYESGYRELRNQVFAHKVASDPAVISAFVAKTNIREMQRLFVFLLKLHDALWKLFVNGRKPVLRPLRYSVTRMRRILSPNSSGVQESITRATEQALLSASRAAGGLP
jgi:AbiU2